MALIAKAGGSGAGFTPIDEGTYTAICYGLVDVGEQLITYDKHEKAVYQIVVMWEIPDETIEIDGEDKPRVINKIYTLSLHEKSGLRKDLKSWRGREFTEEELAGFDMVNIVGVPCLINIVHSTKGEKTYANISGIMALPKGMPKPKSTIAKMVFDIDKATDADLEKLPEWLQNKVTGSLTWKSKKLDKLTEKAKESGIEFEELDDEDGDLPF